MDAGSTYMRGRDGSHASEMVLSKWFAICDLDALFVITDLCRRVVFNLAAASELRARETSRVSRS